MAEGEWSRLRPECSQRQQEAILWLVAAGNMLPLALHKQLGASPVFSQHLHMLLAALPHAAA